MLDWIYVDIGYQLTFHILMQRVLFISYCRDTSIVIWDTINALAEEYIRACTLTRYDRQDVHVYENCHDLIHTGMNAISLGTRLFLNHICESAAL